MLCVLRVVGDENELLVSRNISTQLDVGIFDFAKLIFPVTIGMRPYQNDSILTRPFGSEAE